MNREEQARDAGLPEGSEHKGAGAAGPAYRPIRARLLLQVEEREPTPVVEFEPLRDGEFWRSREDCDQCGGILDAGQLAATLTLEIRELLEAQRAREEGP
jgi:hypothetical protein